MQQELEVMRVLRLPPRGKLVVEVGGQRYESLADVTQPALRQRLTAAIGELVTFAGGYNVLVDAGVAPLLLTTAPSARSPVEADVVSSTAVSGPAPTLTEQQTAFLESLERQRDELKQAAEGPRRRSALSSLVLGQPAKPAVIEAPVEPIGPPAKLTIVEQIDQILQRHLATDPQLARRSIHLEQAPGGGLRIVVDGKYYQRPGEIEEKDIQLFIKMALKEWEGH
jgi:hypothetical protein